MPEPALVRKDGFPTIPAMLRDVPKLGSLSPGAQRRVGNAKAGSYFLCEGAGPMLTETRAFETSFLPGLGRCRTTMSCLACRPRETVTLPSLQCALLSARLALLSESPLSDGTTQRRAAACAFSTSRASNSRRALSMPSSSSCLLCSWAICAASHSLNVWAEASFPDSADFGEPFDSYGPPEPGADSSAAAMEGRAFVRDTPVPPVLLASTSQDMDRPTSPAVN